MKLLYCGSCHDVVRLIKTRKQCDCGKSSGEYVDDITAQYRGPKAKMLGINNSSFLKALRRHNDRNSRGTEFNAFVIPDSVESVKRECE